MADPTAPTDDARLAELLEVIVALAANELTRRAYVGDGEAVLDGIATGINMLAEELDHQRRLEREHHQRAQRSERLAILGQLAAQVAHDVNTPASFALANLSTLEEQLDAIERWAHGASPPPEVLVALRDARVSAREGLTGLERIVTSVRELRSFARRGERKNEPVLVVSVVEDARRLVSKEILCRARLVVEQAGEPMVQGDRASLTQAVVNLLLHAAQSIPEGSPGAHRVTVSTAVEGRSVVLRVEDTGRGISPDAAHRVFEPYVDPHEREPGQGLGLAVAREIVQEHGGTLGFESAVGQGSTFVMRLPVHDLLAEAPAPKPLPRVLMIDDEPLVLDAFSRLLRRQCELVAVRGGAEAIELLGRDRRWDLVVCDVMMPEVDGPAVHAWVTAHAPALLEVFVFCTGGAFTARATSFLQSYQGRVLDKPLRRQALLDTLAALGK